MTDTTQDQFDIRIDHQFKPNMTFFGRYSFVDTLTFRPAPLPGLAEGSFNDAFGSNDNRSQGLALWLDLDDVAQSWSGISASVMREVTITPTRPTSASTVRCKSV